jgi:hypothetical protein
MLAIIITLGVVLPAPVTGPDFSALDFDPIDFST